MGNGIWKEIEHPYGMLVFLFLAIARSDRHWPSSDHGCTSFRETEMGFSMAMNMCILASGSSGNCIYIASATTGVLIDAGLSGRETAKRLAAADAGLDTIRAVCLTHEHSDHIAGLGVLQSRHGWPVYANRGTIDALSADARLAALPWKVFATGSPFVVGDLTLEPFAVSHDAFEPVGFVVSCAEGRVGLVTDIGVVTHLVRERLRHCHALVVESNHDEQLLHGADRPWYLKQRIAGRQGHLSNQSAAELVADVAGTEVDTVFLTHLSQDCNRPDLALSTMTAHLQTHGLPQVAVKLGYADRISEVWHRTSGRPAP